MHSSEALARQSEVETKLADWQRLLRARMLVDTNFARQITAMANPRDAAERAVFRDSTREMTWARQQLANGVASKDGIAFAELAPFVDKPGIDQIRRIIAGLEAERDALRAHLERWPNSSTRHPYRYTGPVFKTMWEGRYLQPGDVVELNATQAAAFADRFAPEEVAA
jgi:hypothetical protein